MRVSGNSIGSIAAWVWAPLIALSLAAGAGFVYAPLPTLVAVGAVFALGLWLVVRGSRAKVAKGQIVGLEGGAVGGLGSRPWVRKLVSVYLLVFWVVMVLPMLEVAPREVGDQTAQAAASGSLQNQVLVGSYGLIGLLFLPRVLMRLDTAFRWVLGLWVLYLSWGYATLFWTAYYPLTTRGLLAFALVSLGSLGFGAGFYGSRPDGARLLLKHIFIVGAISSLVIIVPLPLHLGQYNPFDPSQRLIINADFTKYVSRPVLSALLVLAMTSVIGLRRWRAWDWLWVVVLLAPIMVLKTRGPLLWMILAFGLVYLIYRARIHERVFQAGLMLLVAFATYVSYSRGVIEFLIPYLARGDVEQAATLTGRTDIWDVVIPEILQNPLVGVGFAAFWNPVNLPRMEGAVGFPVVSAHNGFLEELLSTGVIGLGLFLVFWIYVMVLATTRGIRGEPLGWLLLLFMVFYLLLNVTTSLMQNYLEVPFMIVFALLGLMASRSAASAQRETAEAARDASPVVR